MRVRGGTASPSPTEPVLPWQHASLKDWMIVAIHHQFDENGAKCLSVTMVKYSSQGFIAVYGEDSPELWNQLRSKAAVYDEGV